MDHDPFMLEAVRLARLGGTRVSPNPRVGAVVVRDGQIVGRGWHREYSGPHAEVFALGEAAAAARGATLYCTLEPCNHTGKTPPCVKSIIAAGIRTVVIGTFDPNPVAAGGAAALRAAGIDVGTGVLEPACVALNAPFFKFVKTGLPLVTVKWAMSADGKIAATGGDSRWISSETSRALGHRLRAQHDAVLIGIGTLIADEAQLTCRSEVPDPPGLRQPRRIILDTSARTPLDAPLWDARGYADSHGGPITIVCSSAAPADRIIALRARGAEILHPTLTSDGRLDVLDVLKLLGQQRILSVMIEGGSAVLGSFLDAGLADRAYVFVAPKIIGGAASLTAVGGVGVTKVSNAPVIRSPRIIPTDSDVVISGALSDFGDWDDLTAVG